MQSPRNLRSRAQAKPSAAAGPSGKKKEKVGSRFNSKYFANDIIAKLDDRKRKIITDYGFGVLLEFDGCAVPKRLVRWIADQVDVNCYDLRIRGKLIPLEGLSVHLFLGLPIGGKEIKHSNEVKKKFLDVIKVDRLPTIKYFGDKLVKGDLFDEDVFRYFMIVALSYFLCANSNTYPSPSYLEPLIDLSTVGQWDWSQYVFDWTFDSIRKYRLKAHNTIGGCRYFLAVSLIFCLSSMVC